MKKVLKNKEENLKLTTLGFTLIELLAVIIILAAIALIIAPLVLDIIREQQRKTFKESINGILRSSRLEIVNSGLSFPATFTYSDGKLLSPTGKELKVTGKIPEGSGSVRYNSEDDIDLAIHDNSWCGTYNKTSKEIDVNELDGECVVQVAYTPEKCFTFDSSTGTITKYKKSDNDCPVDVVIPETIGGVTVKAIGQAAFIENWDGNGEATTGDSKHIKSVVFPSSLETIGYGAVGGRVSEIIFNEITNLDFSKATSLTSIGESAFRENQLTSVDLSGLTSLQTIGAYAFLENQLTSVDLSGLTSLQTIGEWSFYGNQLTSVKFGTISSLTEIKDYAFCNTRDSASTYDKIPDSVTINHGFSCAMPD